MENKKIKILTPLFFCLFITSIFAQNQSSNEIGFITGSASFTTDYGQRYNFKSNVGGNVGPALGLVYYFNFTGYRYRWNQRSSYFRNHFRVRTEFSYMTAKLNHFGEYVEGDTTGAKQLQGMHGSAQVFNLGAQMEYHLINIVDFGTRRYSSLKFSPYVSLGVFADFYNPTLEVDQSLGIFPKWAGDNHDDSAGITGSITGGVGTRLKLGEYSDLLFEARWQYFLTDWVDGLNAKNDPANKYNDWLLFLQIGYVYYLN